METRHVSPLGWLAVALIVAVVLMGVFATLSMSSYGGYGMMGGSWGWGLAMMAVPGVILIVVLLAALGGLGQGPRTSPYPVYGPPIASARDILDQRYARGEVSAEEYQRMRVDLTRGPQPPSG